MKKILVISILALFSSLSQASDPLSFTKDIEATCSIELEQTDGTVTFSGQNYTNDSSVFFTTHSNVKSGMVKVKYIPGISHVTNISGQRKSVRVRDVRNKVFVEHSTELYQSGKEVKLGVRIQDKFKNMRAGLITVPITLEVNCVEASILPI